MGKRQVSGYEAFSPGTSLKSKIVLCEVHEQQLGLSLNAREYFAFHDLPGVKKAYGCSEIAVGWEVTVMD